MADPVVVQTLKVPRAALLAALNNDRRVALAIESLASDVGGTLPNSIDSLAVYAESILGLVEQVHAIAINARETADRATRALVAVEQMAVALTTARQPDLSVILGRIKAVESILAGR